MINRVEAIKKKGFSMPLARDLADNAYTPAQFDRIKIGIKALDDATLDLGFYSKINEKWGKKDTVVKAIVKDDVVSMRNISEFYYKTSGIYKRLCRYMAYLYRYDWLITPYINGGLGVVADADVTLSRNNRDTILTNFFKALKYLDDFGLKKFFGRVALQVIKYGCYYGYIIQQADKLSVQELPPVYCRTRFSVNGNPAVEFNMQFFDTMFRTDEQREKMLKLFPDEFAVGYRKYKQGKLKPDFPGDSAGWYLLDPENCFKFNINGDDSPFFISVIPSIIDLDQAKDLDRKRMAQKLLKIIIQKMPIDKNGDLVFDVDEARELHNNAVQMLSRAIGIDVLTTFADVDVADMSDRSNTTQTDDLERVERSLFNEAGVPEQLFNAEGNIALNNSILNDEASLKDLISQFEDFINRILKPYNRNPKKCYYKAQILTTTIYNYKEMAKLYKEQTQMGYSKVLPQIALGQSQSSILANAYFENDVLDLVSVFVPPLTSNTMNAEALALRNGNRNGGGSGSSGAQSSPSEGEVGRPEKEDNEKSDKTLQNRESM